MERSQVREILNQEFARFEWNYQPPFQTQPIRFEYFSELFNFAERQKRFWSAQAMPIAQQVRHHWENIHTRLEYVSGLAKPHPSMNETLVGVLRDLQAQDWPNIPEESLLATKIINCSYPDDTTRWEGFLAGALSKHNPQRTANVRNQASIIGLLEGVAFSEPSIVTQFVGKTHEQLHRQYEARIIEAENMHKSYGELTLNLQNTFKENQAALEKWRNEKVESLNTELKNLRDDFQSLKDLYTEKLKLEAPAQYWQKRATRMRWAGVIWLVVSIGFFIGVGAILWHNFIAPSTFIDANNVPNQAANAAATKDSLLAYFSSAKNIRALIGFSVITSLYFFVLRMLIRLTISSFHLSLDAAEREQLTYVYLALIEKGQKGQEKLIQDSERAIILQSLFSRADTGLLAGDSAPTMPGVTDAASIIRGSK